MGSLQASGWREPAGGAVLERRAALEPTLDSPREARRLLRRFLEEVGRSDWLEAGELAISEIVTNGSLHGHTTMQLRLVAYEDLAYVEVRDSNASMPAPRAYEREASTGRGMALVSAVTAQCGASSLGPEGKVVWFCLTAAQTPGPPVAADWDLTDADARPRHGSGTTTEIVLSSMPAMLWLSAREHQDAILRELVLYRAEHREVVGADLDADIVAADRARSTVSGALLRAIDAARASGVVRPAAPDGHPGPLPWVPEHLDLVVTVGTEAARQFATLQDVLDAAERLAASGELLCRPGLPEIVAVRDWACEQVIAQLSGIAPASWPGTAQERFEVEVHGREDEDAGWNSLFVVESDRRVVAADEANRIVAVSRPLAELLGWDPAELTGRRVVTLVPHALREAHVAGFSRHLTSGEARVLGVPLILPVLARDGSEVNCRFLIEQTAAARGRSMYLAWIDPI